MNKDERILGLILVLLLAAGTYFLNQTKHVHQLAVRNKRSNPVRLYIPREIKTDLYTPHEGPAPLTGWDMSGIGRKGWSATIKTSKSTKRRKQRVSADSTQARNNGKRLDSLTSANRDSAASK
ncbi:hypothetical protein MUK70_14820 [Dyadobacter chenwenxiniae]|uniref:Uncharacterized protein n=1 Tax=Dyadobacter chenwenxiniae TaxID=2906456 RepID=A0A9X1PHR0_9BACT|nr:hypothetical protein [Dyadobacter chenwenxiniae]MCF0060515.1 hypothetical protein [Dyadobacter chenwenxiniae]UON86247.1 hypothetical protein MUK70_14820 [Dyadobacter chenwenxiniae]